MSLTDAALAVADMRVPGRLADLRTSVLEHLQGVPDAQRGAETIATVGAIGKLLAEMTAGNATLAGYARQWGGGER